MFHPQQMKEFPTPGSSSKKDEKRGRDEAGVVACHPCFQIFWPYLVFLLNHLTSIIIAIYGSFFHRKIKHWLISVWHDASANFERTVLGHPADHRGVPLENGEGDLVQQKPCLVSAEPCHHTHTHTNTMATVIKIHQVSMAIYGKSMAHHCSVVFFRRARLRAASRRFGALTRTVQAWHLFVASIESGIRWLFWEASWRRQNAVTCAPTLGRAP